jgi:hypothetical protein
VNVLTLEKNIMRSTVISSVAAVLICLGLAPAVHAQAAQSSGTQVTAAQSPGTAVTAVPRLVWFSGAFSPADRSAAAAVESVTLSVYHDETGGEPIWQETQNVVVGAGGRFNVLVGSVTPHGLPVDLFTSGEPRWLGVKFSRAGEQEQPRVQLASVPYALKAIDADTLGGRPASAYALAEAWPRVGTPVIIGRDGKPSTGDTDPPFITSTAGTAGRIGVFTDAANLGNSEITQFGMGAGSRIGVGTATPQDYFHVSFDDQFGAFTGFAVQNRNGSANASSGMLFYDQNGAVAQFQGFNNTNHAYVINNIATGGSISFLTANVSRFTVASNGNIGIGTTTPATRLQVAGDVTVDGNIGAKYQDVAEWVETATPLEAGTVVIVDPTQPNRVQAAAKAYDARVAGAVSRQPGIVLGERSDSRVMVAQSGRVRVKADARYGAIRIGDLLVTSPTEGHVMRSRPIKMGAQSMHRPGTLVGKALEALPSGKGEILVLLTLQ